MWTASFRHVSTQLFPPGRGEIARSIIHIPVGGVNLAGEQGSCAQPAVIKLSIGAARGAVGSKQSAALPATSRVLYCSESRDCAWLPAELAAVGMPSAAVCVPWSVLACASFLEAAADGRISGAGQRRPRHRSGHLHKTGTEPGQMAGTNAGAIRVAHCWPQARQSFAAVWWLSSCRHCTLAGCSPWWWRVAAVCRRPVKVPLPKLPGRDLYRPSMDANLGMRLDWSSVGLCHDIWDCVCPSARGAAGSKQSTASPAISSLLLPAPLGSAAAIALDWGVWGGGSSTSEGCSLNGQAER